MKPTLRLAAVLLAPTLPFGGVASGPAMAQVRHNSAAPIDFDAAYIELQDRANRAILSGGVAIRQANMTLNADRVTVAYTGAVIDGSPQVSRLDAAGGVTVARPDQNARSRYAVYDLNRRVITMIGDVTLIQGSNTVRGGRLSINLDTGRATIDGSGVASGGPAEGGVTNQGGRVTGRFSVPKRGQ
ncbi:MULTISPECIES: LptA/OstA family protein [unclassified Sphingomonas]|jgi:lipopolysaccharide export system protein LptA|uniref:LptA/OstA family protein n=1 Tax=unclassified Sphingomonas TaxID=196159 RepID=UPI00082B9FBE|nr:OstA family protein [Sphingomonas sp. SFZ2018-12]